MNRFVIILIIFSNVHLRGCADSARRSSNREGNFDFASPITRDQYKKPRFMEVGASPLSSSIFTVLLKVEVKLNVTYCHGSIIAPQHILTAASCVDTVAPEAVTVTHPVLEIPGYSGTYYIRSYKVRWIAVHPEFKNNYKRNLAVMELELPIGAATSSMNDTGYEYVQQLALPIEEVNMVNRAVGFILGFSFPMKPYLSPPENSLAKLALKVRSRDFCLKYFPYFDASYMFCANHKAYEDHYEKAEIRITHVSPGDIGIGYIEFGNSAINYDFIIYGVATNAQRRHPRDRQATDMYRPTLFTKVYPEVDWIREVILNPPSEKMEEKEEEEKKGKREKKEKRAKRERRQKGPCICL